MAEEEKLFPERGGEVLRAALSPEPAAGPPFTHLVGPAPDPTTPEALFETARREHALRESRRHSPAVVEGEVVRSEDSVTVMQLITGLINLVNSQPELAALPVAVETHCCVEDLRADDPEVREEPRGIRLADPVRRYVVLRAGG